jgi:uncharacterized protein
MRPFAGDAVAGTSLALRVIDPSHHRVMPWRNGFGTTTEIAIDPPDSGVGGRFRWRLSIAAVERSGPFSAFPGYERTIMVIAGRGMDLAVGNWPPRRLDRLFEPFVFSGDSTAECQLLDGPIRDFNLMAERSSLRSHLEVVHLDATSRSFEVPIGNLIIHCFDGVIDLASRIGAPVGTLSPNCTAICSHSVGGGNELQATAAGRATAVIIDLTPA